MPKRIASKCGELHGNSRGTMPGAPTLTFCNALPGVGKFALIGVKRSRSLAVSATEAGPPA